MSYIFGGVAAAPTPGPEPAPDLGGVLTKYYVRPGGSDSNDGLTIPTAFATLAHAISILPAIYTNGYFFIDITGIEEDMVSKVISVYGWPGAFGTDPQALLGLWFGAVCIHADLTVDLTLDAGHLVSIAANAITTQQTLTTDGGLTPNSLIGCFVRQSGVIVGVVKSNDTVDIVTTCVDLNTSFDVEFCSPGAILYNVNYTNALYDTTIEGVEVQTTNYSISLSAFYSQGGITAICCEIGTFGTGFNLNQMQLFDCYIIPSTGGYPSCDSYTGFAAIASFFDTVGFVEITSFSFGNGQDFTRCAFEDCGPIFASSLSQSLGAGSADLCEFLNPITNAVSINGPGSFIITNSTIDGAGSHAIQLAQGSLSVSNIPAGVGNAGVGVRLTEGAHLISNRTTPILLTGADGDVTIGNLPVTSWANVNAQLNNRVSDFNQNGDGSSVFYP